MENMQDSVTLRTDLPKIDLRLLGQDGNAYNVLGLFCNAAKKAQWPADQIELVMNDAMSDDYNHLLAVVMRYCKNPMGEKDSEDEHEYDDDDDDDNSDDWDNDEDLDDDDDDDDEPEDDK
jgi:hypothetical protein